MSTFAQWFWLLVWWFVFFAYLVILFQIIGDLFRDRELSGWWKALWIVGLIGLPFLVALVYVIARGRSMAERQARDLVEAKSQTDAYIQSVAGSSPAAQISSAKTLLDQGAIDEREFSALKAKALA